MSNPLSLFSVNAQSKAGGETSVRGQSVLTEATRHVDMLHISLIGLTAIILVLLLAVALPVFGFVPVSSKGNFVVITVTTFAGIAYLYYLNYEVHHMVSDHARLTEVLVNSLGQGFLSFRQDGICDDVYSQACSDILGILPSGKSIADVLRVPEEGRANFNDWLDVLFVPNHALSFADVVNFLPQFFPHPEGRRISLVYKPIYNKQGALARVVLIATDQTDEYAAQQLAQKRQDYADMICRIFRERNQFRATIAHIRKFIEESSAPVSRENASGLLRMLHTLKAAVKHFHLNNLASVVHTLETDLRNENIETDQQFMDIMANGRRRIETELVALLDELKGLVGGDYENRGNIHEIEESALYSFALVMNVSGVNADIVDHYLRNIVAVPLQDCLRQFEHEIQDLSEMTGKQLKPLTYSGINPPVLTRKLHALMFSLTHICRNIIDHGIEATVTRIARGKDPLGQVAIHLDVVSDPENASQSLLISIVSDPEGSWRNQDDHEVIQNIFSWGFSTRDVVTDLSGRGVGLEVVAREVQALGGNIQVFSEIYKGTRFEIRIPYTIDI